MKAEDWKAGLDENCNAVLGKYKELVAHIDALENLDDEDIDVDDLLIFMQVKLLKFNKAVDALTD